MQLLEPVRDFWRRLTAWDLLPTPGRRALGAMGPWSGRGATTGTTCPSARPARTFRRATTRRPAAGGGSCARDARRRALGAADDGRASRRAVAALLGGDVPACGSGTASRCCVRRARARRGRTRTCVSTRRIRCRSSSSSRTCICTRATARTPWCGWLRRSRGTSASAARSRAARNVSRRGLSSPRVSDARSALHLQSACAARVGAGCRSRVWRLNVCVRGFSTRKISCAKSPLMSQATLAR